MKEVANTYRIQMRYYITVPTIRKTSFFVCRRTDMKGDPISSGYLSDHESKLQDMVQQLSVESQDSRFCYLTSSEVCSFMGFWYWRDDAWYWFFFFRYLTMSACLWQQPFLMTRLTDLPPLRVRDLSIPPPPSTARARSEKPDFSPSKNGWFGRNIR